MKFVVWQDVIIIHYITAERKKQYESINLPHLQILTVQICKLRRFIYMKATGIVRRIDDLGRVVIPKEIRRTMRIREGDPS